MVEVEIRTPTINEETQEIGSEGLALIRAVDGEVTIWGEEDVIHRDPVMSIKRGKPVAVDEDPEEWARSLPYAYRAGDLFAVVLQDDDPPTLEHGQSLDERPEPALPDAPAPATIEAEKRAVAP